LPGLSGGSSSSSAALGGDVDAELDGSSAFDVPAFLRRQDG
jgi:hypothetical protein